MTPSSTLHAAVRPRRRPAHRSDGRLPSPAIAAGWAALRALAVGWLAGGAAVTALAFDLQGHRGARGLAPENTLAGIRQALAIGVTTLELDVVLSADGVPVLSHDTTPNPDITRDARGRWLQARGRPFAQLTARDIRAFDVGRIHPGSRYAREFPDQVPVDGERIPTLAAVFREVRALGAHHVRFNLETKINPTRPDESPSPEALARAVLRVARQHQWLDRISLQSFDWRTLQAARRLAPDVPRVHLTVQRPNADNLSSGAWTGQHRLGDHDDAPSLVAAAGGQVWSPHHANLSPALVARAHALGLRVIPWTVNDTADMERLIDWGVDGLITDRPDRLRAVMDQRSMPLPPAVPLPRRPASPGPDTAPPR